MWPPVDQIVDQRAELCQDDDSVVAIHNTEAYVFHTAVEIGSDKQQAHCNIAEHFYKSIWSRLQ